MVLRYLVDGVDNKPPIGIAYNLRTGKMVVGSRKKCLETMSALIVDFFGIKAIPKPKEFGGHRVRIELLISYRRWSRGIKDMILYEIGISQVQSFHRLMR